MSSIIEIQQCHQGANLPRTECRKGSTRSSKMLGTRSLNSLSKLWKIRNRLKEETINNLILWSHYIKSKIKEVFTTLAKSNSVKLTTTRGSSMSRFFSTLKSKGRALATITVSSHSLLFRFRGNLLTSRKPRKLQPTQWSISLGESHLTRTLTTAERTTSMTMIWSETKSIESGPNMMPTGPGLLTRSRLPTSCAITCPLRGFLRHRWKLLEDSSLNLTATEMVSFLKWKWPGLSNNTWCSQEWNPLTKTWAHPKMLSNSRSIEFGASMIETETASWTWTRHLPSSKTSCPTRVLLFRRCLCSADSSKSSTSTKTATSQSQRWLISSENSWWTKL